MKGERREWRESRMRKKGDRSEGERVSVEGRDSEKGRTE